MKREKRETLKEGRKGKGVGYRERSQLHRGEDARQVEEEAHAPSEAEAPQDEAALQVGSAPAGAWTSPEMAGVGTGA